MSLRTIVDAHRRRRWTQFSAVRRRITQFLPTIPAFGVPIRADTIGNSTEIFGVRKSESLGYRVAYDTIRCGTSTCAQKLTNLAHGPETKNKEKIKSKTE